MAGFADSTLAPSAHTPTRRDLFKAAPIAAAALAMPAGALAASTVDAQIVAAWERKVAAYRAYNSTPVHNVDVDGADENFWPVIDQCDKIIHAATATTPLGVELQIWTGLQNSSAYTTEEERAILSRDLAYLEQHKQAFDWDAQPMIAAIRSLRAMGSR